MTFVAVHFDGYGDEGTTEEMKCYDSEWYAWGEHEPVNHDASHLQEHFEALVPFGYENDWGGFGDVVLDVSARLLASSDKRFVWASIAYIYGIPGIPERYPPSKLNSYPASHFFFPLLVSSFPYISLPTRGFPCLSYRPSTRRSSPAPASGGCSSWA